jgi:hypothetical protein
VTVSVGLGIGFLPDFAGRIFAIFAKVARVALGMILPAKFAPDEAASAAPRQAALASRAAVGKSDCRDGDGHCQSR